MKIPDIVATLGRGDTVTSTVTKSQTQEPYAQDDTLYPDPSPPAFKVNHSLRKNALGKAGLGGSIMHLRTPLPTAHHTLFSGPQLKERDSLFTHFV